MESPAKTIRFHLPRTFQGEIWDALIHSVATGDEYLNDLAQKAFKQAHLSTAEGIYLERHAANVGMSAPPGIGIDPDSLRKLVIQFTNQKLTTNSISRILEIFYGSRVTRAHVVSGPGPFVISNRTFKIATNGDEPVTVQLEGSTPLEIALFISKAIDGCFAKVEDDKIIVFSSVLGLGGSIEIFDSSAAQALGFPIGKRTVYDGVSSSFLAEAGSLEVILPAVSEVVQRTPESASYLYSIDSGKITKVQKEGKKVTVFTDTPVTEGWVEVQNVYLPPSESTYSIIPGIASSAGASASVVNDTLYFATDRMNVFDGDWTSYPIDSRTAIKTLALPTGEILITGDSVDNELFITKHKLSVPTGQMNYARTNHSLTLLDEHKVLVWGGWKVGEPMNKKGEIYDTRTGLFTLTNLEDIDFRSGHKAAKLSDGRVAIFGGSNVLDEPLTTAIWDSVSNGTVFSLSSDPFHEFIIKKFDVLFVPFVGPSGKVFLACHVEGNLVFYWFNPSTLSFEEIKRITNTPEEDIAVCMVGKRILILYGDKALLFDPRTNKTREIEGTEESFEAVSFGSGAFMYGDVSSNFLSFPDPVGERVNGTHKIEESNETSFSFFVEAESSFEFEPSNATFVSYSVKDGSGPYLYGVAGAPTKIRGRTVTPLFKNNSYTHLEVDDASEFPTSGYLVFQLGYENEVFPVKYIAKPNNTTLVLDSSFIFPSTIHPGSEVALLKDVGLWEPDRPELLGALYLTASTSGRVGASSLLDQMVAADTELVKTVVYPSDRGLGGEGLPVTGQKLPDKIFVWGGEDIDSETEGARK